VAGLTHRFDVGQGVRSTSGDAVNFPFTPQHRVAPSTMMRAGGHCAFTTATCSIIDIITKSQGRPTSFLFWI
jgi:hypothetical protein